MKPVGMTIYAECSGQELYCSVVGNSKNLREYIGAPFYLAAYDVLKYRISFIGVLTGVDRDFVERV